MSLSGHKPAFLPMTRAELDQLGWEQPDVILISGDAYIDSPYIGIALLGKWLLHHGFTVAVIAQPDLDSQDIARLGEPKLFWGVSGGSVDSMVANYTASGKKRRNDDYTPGGVNDRRPDRAVIAYVNAIRKAFKPTVPIVLGGIEASLRRITHYDFWSDKLRRSLLFDSKADYLIYGMAEKPIIELANAFKTGENPQMIRGLCYAGKEPKESYLQLPSHEETLKDKRKFIEAFELFYDNNDPVTAKGLCQLQDSRYLIQNPPAELMLESEMDAVFDLGFTRQPHPIHQKEGAIKAQETIRFSITTHYGCYGECSFCAIAVHQGRTIQGRSEDSILREVDRISAMPEFKGYITDVGGPTANMYGFECAKKMRHGVCADKPCVGFRNCKSLKPSHARQIALLRKIRQKNGIKKAFVASGIRYDLIEDDKAHGDAYLEEIVRHHVSGQLKVAPEHIDDHVLKLMNKPGKASLLRFKRKFDALNQKAGKKQFLTYYFIAAHPGCGEAEMEQLKRFSSRELKISPEQVQVFTPTPSTYAALMYYTGIDPQSGREIYVEKSLAGKNRQKSMVCQRDTRTQKRASTPNSTRRYSR